MKQSKSLKKIQLTIIKKMMFDEKDTCLISEHCRVNTCDTFWKHSKLNIEHTSLLLANSERSFALGPGWWEVRWKMKVFPLDI